jgi:EF-P beta-lysylation protein EpmB
LSEELEAHPGYIADPVGDRAAIAGTALLQKYHGRALVLTTGACAVHCRYCFRRHFPYGEESVTRSGWRTTLAELAKLADESGLDEVILSGGDPLSLSDARLIEIIEDLGRIASLRRLRLHTRLPVVLPQRLTRRLIDTLRDSRLDAVLVLHANHPREIAPVLQERLEPLRHEPITLLNQAVLLRGINDSAETLVELSEALFTAGVLPYYLHQLDPVAGAAHFAVPTARATELLRRVQARLPGYLVPKLVRETPGAASKLPLSDSGSFS